MQPTRLRLTSKKLDSGRFQVNFTTHSGSDGVDGINSRVGEEFYGYLLTESQTPVREVVEKIHRHIDAMKYSERYFQRNLFSLTHREPKANTGRILIFRSEKRKAA